MSTNTRMTENAGRDPQGSAREAARQTEERYANGAESWTAPLPASPGFHAMRHDEPPRRSGPTTST